VKLIPLGMLRHRVEELPREKRIIPFCKISLRGCEAQTILSGVGFKNVQFVDGEIEA
jgi:rhodanese-related sulfurtransferase